MIIRLVEMCYVALAAHDHLAFVRITASRVGGDLDGNPSGRTQAEPASALPVTNSALRLGTCASLGLHLSIIRPSCVRGITQRRAENHQAPSASASATVVTRQHALADSSHDVQLFFANHHVQPTHEIVRVTPRNN
ncbi:MAG TPA: hypothetical protein VFV64_02595 [Permianibacter sp.]|nr:hypothetical protein [Permianibacter sp.]